MTTGRVHFTRCLQLAARHGCYCSVGLFRHSAISSAAHTCAVYARASQSRMLNVGALSWRGGSRLRCLIVTGARPSAAESTAGVLSGCGDLGAQAGPSCVLDDGRRRRVYVNSETASLTNRIFTIQFHFGDPVRYQCSWRQWNVGRRAQLVSPW